MNVETVGDLIHMQRENDILNKKLEVAMRTLREIGDDWFIDANGMKCKTDTAMVAVTGIMEIMGIKDT